MSSKYEETMKTKPFLPFRLDHVPEEIMEKARKELNETEEARASGIVELRKLVQAEEGLQCRTDNKFLLHYLRARKFNTKRAFHLIKGCYELLNSYPEVFNECDEEKMRIIFASGGMYCLPYRDADGCAVVVMEMNLWNPDEHDVISTIHCMVMLLSFAVYEVATQVCGMKIIFNVGGTTLRQIRHMTPRYLYMTAKAMRNAFPIRFKAVHFYNESKIFQYAWTILKMFHSEKIKRRIHFNGDNFKQLHKFIPKDILPKGYGGDNLNFNPSEWCRTELEGFYETYRTIIGPCLKN